MLKTIAEKTRADSNGQRNYVYGLQGLADVLGCSKATAHRYKNSGTIPFAKIGKKFIFDVDNVMSALTQKGKEVQNG